MKLQNAVRAGSSLAALSVAWLASAPIALAQTAPAPVPGPAPQGGPDKLEVIVVTAQKRAQNLQDVPVVVSVVGKQQLRDAGVHDIKDLSNVTPGLTVTSTTSEAVTTARIRGIGTVGDNVGLEPSVGVVIDGVYRPRNGVGFNDLGDVDRIEVLKGPQGTLFGKSTSAGVINIVTAQPSFHFGANAEFTAGNYNAYGGSGEVTGPLVADRLAASLYFADRQRDGFYKVDPGSGPATATRSQNQNFFTVRGQLLYEPGSNLTVRIIGDYTHHDEMCCAATPYRSGKALDAAGDTVQSIVAGLSGVAAENTAPNPYSRQAFGDQPGAQDIVDEGLSAQVDYKMPSLDATLTSVTAVRNWSALNGGDVDFSDADLLVRPDNDSNSERFTDVSQEVRFAGSHGRIDYLVGAFYANEALRDNYSLLFGDQFTRYLGEALGSLSGFGPFPGLLQVLFGPNATYPGGQGSVDRYRQRENSYAVFTNETVRVTDKFEINLGLRYTVDDKTLSSNNANIGTGQGCNAVVSSPLSQGGLIPQFAINALCLPFQSPAFNDFNNKQSDSEKEVSGTAKLIYHVEPWLLTYASYARGYKAGGFNLDRVGCPNQPGCPVLASGASVALTADTDTAFKPEFSDSLELGAKSTLFDRRVTLNAALFYEKFTGYQYNTFNGLVFVVASLPAVYSSGLDADLTWRPIRSLVLQAGVTIADTRFSRGDQSILVDTAGFLGSPSARLPFAPAYSSALSATYTYVLPRDYRLRFNLGTKFNSSYNTGSDLDPDKVQKAFFVTDGRIVFGPADSRYDVEFWAQNLFDTHYVQVAFDAPFQNLPSNATGKLDAFLGAPRTFGVTVRAKI